MLTSELLIFWVVKKIFAAEKKDDVNFSTDYKSNKLKSWSEQMVLVAGDEAPWRSLLGEARRRPEEEVQVFSALTLTFDLQSSITVVVGPPYWQLVHPQGSRAPPFGNRRVNLKTY